MNWGYVVVWVGEGRRTGRATGELVWVQREGGRRWLMAAMIATSRLAEDSGPIYGLQGLKQRHVENMGTEKPLEAEEMSNGKQIL
ncbi:hypothetical protein HPP92_028396 [Vanilla planifolia]|uniref:Uncharacterized protein n=1 Tax=Vanilla planifolia TaxID=51239 RepID=A0A835U3S2_VANPL|nr:hypothetical protein HPP92_028396 [Vanilla planifolia]